MKKILLIAVTSQSVMTFRRSLIAELQNNGYAVSVIAFDREYEQDVLDLGVDFYCIEDSNRSVNPLRILTLQRRYARVIQAIAPDTVFTFMLKPNIFGAPAARSAKVKKIYSMVEGAGDVFINNSPKWKIVRAVVCFLYKRAFRCSDKVFFLNTDDISEFTSRGLLPEAKCSLIHGIGVDLVYFSQKPLQNRKSFLMVARMLHNKGVIDYCECARRVKKKHPDAYFGYLGGEGNVTLSDIKDYIDDGSVDYLGTAKDVRTYLESCTCLVLPSMREGCPVSVMEAEATGRAIITTNNVGCRETVTENYNGFLVDCHDVDAMVEKCEYLIDNPEEAEKMCRNSRIFAEEHFDQSKINKQIITILEQE